MAATRLLVIGAGFLQSPVLKRAREMGLVVIAVDRDPQAPGFAWASQRAVLDIKDREGCLKIAREEGVEGVVSVCTDHAVRTVAFVTDSLGLPGLSPMAARSCTSKALMREALARGGVGGIQFGRADSLEQAEKVAASLGLPCMVKPVDSVGSRGVTKVNSMGDLPAAFAAASKASSAGDVIQVER